MTLIIIQTFAFLFVDQLNRDYNVRQSRSLAATFPEEYSVHPPFWMIKKKFYYFKIWINHIPIFNNIEWIIHSKKKNSWKSSTIHASTCSSPLKSRRFNSPLVGPIKVDFIWLKCFLLDKYMKGMTGSNEDQQWHYEMMQWKQFFFQFWIIRCATKFLLFVNRWLQQ